MTTPEADCPEAETLEGEAPVRPNTVAERRCLHCGNAFQSAWAGERVCRRCKDSANWREGTTSYTADG